MPRIGPPGRRGGGTRDSESRPGLVRARGPPGRGVKSPGPARAATRDSDGPGARAGPQAARGDHVVLAGRGGP